MIFGKLKQWYVFLFYFDPEGKMISRSLYVTAWFIKQNNLKSLQRSFSAFSFTKKEATQYHLLMEKIVNQEVLWKDCLWIDYGIMAWCHKGNT